MNNRIRNLLYSDALFIDIETVRGEEVFDESHPNYKVWAWRQRDRETNKIPDKKEVIESYYNKAALYPEWGKIVCVSVGYIGKNAIAVTSFTGEEKELLKNAMDVIRKADRLIVGFNLIQFDIPYLRKRFFINGLTNFLEDHKGNDVYAKPWELDNSVFDLMRAWKGSGVANTSMDELAMALGVPSSKGEMKGNEVSEYYYKGKIDQIRKYCEKDVAVTANILRRWKGDDILEYRVK